jgi:hypothetical protein
MSEHTLLEWAETRDWKWTAGDWQIYREPKETGGFALYFGPITSAYCLKHAIPSLEAAKDLAQRLQYTLDEPLLDTDTTRPRRMRYWFFDDGGPDEPLGPRRSIGSTQRKETP